MYKSYIKMCTQQRVIGLCSLYDIRTWAKLNQAKSSQKCYQLPFHINPTFDLHSTVTVIYYIMTGMCTRPFRPRPRRDPRCKGPRPRRGRDRDVEGPKQDRDVPAPETLAEMRGEKKIKHQKINWTSKHFVFVMLWDFAARALCALRGIAAVRPVSL